MEAPEFYQATGFCSQFTNDNKHFSLESKPTTDHFMVEDLLDFSNDDEAIVTTDAGAAVTRNSTDSSTVTVNDSCNSSSFSGCEPSFAGDNHNFHDAHFSNDLSVPYDDLAELEWLSNFVEESFSSEDLQKLQLISGMKALAHESSETQKFQPICSGDNNNIHNSFTNVTANGNSNSPIFHTEMSVPAKARSKRSRAAPCNWASRLLLSPTTSSSEPETIIVPLQHPNSGKRTVKSTAPRKRDSGDGGMANGEGRKCQHCATDKTPQWRTGPMGPKTLCNACGVRYKSGRLVPEYRPAASPTFVLTKHSNSHRKVLELRRQKEMVRAQQQQQPTFLHHHQNMVFDVSSNGDEYLIQQHMGPDFRQMI